MRRRFGSPRFQLHRGETRFQKTQAQPGEVPDFGLRPSGRDARRNREGDRVRSGKFRFRLRGSFVRRRFPHGGGSGPYHSGDERKEAHGLVRTDGGDIARDQARELGGEFSRVRRSGRKRFWAPQGGTGFRYQPHGSVGGRGERERKFQPNPVGSARWRRRLPRALRRTFG